VLARPNREETASRIACASRPRATLEIRGGEEETERPAVSQGKKEGRGLSGDARLPPLPCARDT